MRNEPRSEPPSTNAVRLKRLGATVVAMALFLLTLAPATADAQIPDDRVFILGDSIVVAAEPYILEALPDHTVTVDAIVGRPTTDAARILSERRAELGSIVVIQLGANDAGWGFPAKVESTMIELEDVPVVIWINQNEVRPEYVSANEVLASAAAKWPNLVIADWNSYERSLTDAVRPDGVHLTRTGAKEYGLMIANAVISQTPRAWSSTSSTTIAPAATSQAAAASPVNAEPADAADDTAPENDSQSEAESVDTPAANARTDLGFEEAVRLAVAGGGRAGSTGRIAGLSDEIAERTASPEVPTAAAAATSSRLFRGLTDDLAGIGNFTPAMVSRSIVPASSNRAGTSSSAVAVPPPSAADRSGQLLDEMVDQAEVLGTNVVRAEDDNLLDATELQTPIAGDPLDAFDDLGDEQALPLLPGSTSRGLGPLGYLVVGTILALLARILISALQADTTPR